MVQVAADEAPGAQTSSSSSRFDDSDGYFVPKEDQKHFDGFVAFRLPGCPLVLQSGDLTTWHIDGVRDAIVNTANPSMLGGGGIDGAVHRAAGPDLLRLCKSLPEVETGVRCRPGDAVVTRSGRLPAQFVIHAVPTMFRSEAESMPRLQSLYRNVMSEARDHHVRFIAFPAIGCGVFGYPPDKAAEATIRLLSDEADEFGFVMVHFVFFQNDIMDAWVEAAHRMLKPLHVMLE